jgi:hypothetical protein
MSINNIVKENINIKKVLEKLALYEAQLVDDSDILICKCMFGHIFTICMEDDWCLKCDDEFMETKKKFYNNILQESKHNLCIYQTNKYGIATLICDDNHTSNQLLNNILTYCKQCISTETCDIQPEQIEWNKFMRKSHDKEIEDLRELFDTNCDNEESDKESYSDSYENNSDFHEYVSDSDNENIFTSTFLSLNDGCDESDNERNVDVTECMFDSLYNLPNYTQKNKLDDEIKDQDDSNSEFESLSHDWFSEHVLNNNEDNEEDTLMREFVENMKAHSQMMDFSTVEYNPIELHDTKYIRKMRINNLIFDSNISNMGRYQALKSVHTQMQKKMITY